MLRVEPSYALERGSDVPGEAPSSAAVPAEVAVGEWGGNGGGGGGGERDGAAAREAARSGGRRRGRRARGARRSRQAPTLQL